MVLALFGTSSYVVVERGEVSSAHLAEGDVRGHCTGVRRVRSSLEYQAPDSNRLTAETAALRAPYVLVCKAQALFVNLPAVPVWSARHSILEASCLFLTPRTL